MRLTHQTWLLQLPLFCNDGARTCWIALWFVRRCEKMTRRMFRNKGGRFSLAWYSRISRLIGKCIISDGAYFEQNAFYHSSEFNVFFKKTNPHFVLVHLVNHVRKRTWFTNLTISTYLFCCVHFYRTDLLSFTFTGECTYLSGTLSRGRSAIYGTDVAYAVKYHRDHPRRFIRAGELPINS